MPRPDLRIIRASEHNLRDVSLTIPRGALTVITGLSGSGKSSLAFDTIYAEGQRRYIESLSSYARQFLEALHRPKVEHIEGLSPAISIEQKTASHNPRSTLGTVSEIYDYLRLLFSVAGEPACPECGHALVGMPARDIVERVMAWPEGTRVMVLAPIVRGRKGLYRKELHEALLAGYQRVRVDREYKMLDGTITLDRQKKHTIELVIDRVVVSEADRPRIQSAIDTALRRAEGLVTLDVLPWGERGTPAPGAKPITTPAPPAPEGYPGAGLHEFSEALSCPTHGPQLVEMAPRLFSFNSPYGACPTCKGLGHVPVIEEQGLVADSNLSIAAGALAPYERGTLPSPLEASAGSKLGKTFRTALKQCSIDPDVPWCELPPETRRAFLFHKSEGKGAFEGPGTTLTRWLADPDLTDEMREVLEAYATPQPCPACQGTRLKPQALAVRLRGRNIAELSAMPLDVARAFFEAITWTPREWQIGQQMIQEISDRLRFLNDIGLGYLTLDRPAGTLAGGELQRIRLATQIGSQLTGVLYVLDEPSIGLHMRDNERLIQSLTRLRDMGNTVIVVEHDEATMMAADYLIDLGPGAGRLGGEVVAEGPPAAVMQHPTSLTGQYLSGRRRIEVPSRRRAIDPARQLVVRGAAHHNLRGIDVAVPLGCLVCITGVSGSGKSTLVSDILLPGVARRLGLVAPEPGRHRTIEGIEHLDKIIEVDQSPIGRTPRSNCATYTGAFGLIRDLFAGLPEARMNGYKPGQFSFNVAGGRCEHCKGAGSIKLEMAFLPEVYVECEVCHGRRYSNEILTVRYRDKSIADVLEMSVGDSLEFFAAVPRLQAVLKTVHDVGLDYIQIGQPATTLSGGEAQRIKLSKELARRNTGRTLYLLDEPTTGLHFEDIRKLIEVLQRLVDAGSTVVVVEHNIDVIKCADYVIDLGPEGGTLGGALVVEGTPEDVARHPQSHTGRFLAEALCG